MKYARSVMLLLCSVACSAPGGAGGGSSAGAGGTAGRGANAGRGGGTGGSAGNTGSAGNGGNAGTAGTDGTGGTGGGAPGPDAAPGDTSSPLADAAAADITGSDTPAAPPPPPPGGVFRHPGVLVSRAQLDFIRDKVKAGAQPWLAAFDDSKSRAPLSYVPSPQTVVECGSYSMPNNGCAEEINDAVAAWAHALHWHITGDEGHARKAIEIMNAWSRVFRNHIDSTGRCKRAGRGRCGRERPR